LGHRPVLRPYGASLGWEGEREGIDDYKYVRMLEALTAKLGTDDRRRQKAQATLGRLAAEIPADGHEVLNIPQGWTAETFDRYRREIAEEIVTLTR
jgi:hypothetical protein